MLLQGYSSCQLLTELAIWRALAGSGAGLALAWLTATHLMRRDWLSVRATGLAGLAGLRLQGTRRARPVRNGAALACHLSADLHSVLEGVTVVEANADPELR